jgi:hypothetical protein
MTVKHLIEKLNTIEDQEAWVVVSGYEGGYDDVMNINTAPIEIALDVNKEWYYGKHEKAEDIDRDHLDKFQVVKAIIL